MLTAGLLYATWHSLVKSGENVIVILTGMGAVAGVCAAATVPFVAFPSPEVWPVLLLSIGLAYRLQNLLGERLCTRRIRTGVSALARDDAAVCHPYCIYVAGTGAFAKPVCRDCARRLRIIASRAR